MGDAPPNLVPQVPPLARLRQRGFDVLCTSHAEAVLSKDFPEALADVEAVLAGFTVNVEDCAGDGKTPFAQQPEIALVPDVIRAECPYG